MRVCWPSCSSSPPRSPRRPTSSGKVTNYEGLPLAQVRVTATSVPGNVTAKRAPTTRAAPDLVPGGPGLHHGLRAHRLHLPPIRDQRLADEAVLIADARLNVIQLVTVVTTSSVQQRVNRNQSTPDVGGTERQVSTATCRPKRRRHRAMAASLPGVLLVPASTAALTDSPCSDSAPTRTASRERHAVRRDGLPRDASVRSLSTSPYDVSRGDSAAATSTCAPAEAPTSHARHLDGAQRAAPHVSDRAAQALGSEYTTCLGGVASGPIVLNSRSTTCRTSSAATRATTSAAHTNALGLQSPASRWIPCSAPRHSAAAGCSDEQGPLRTSRVSDNGSLLGSIDYNPPSSTQGTRSTSPQRDLGAAEPVGGGRRSSRRPAVTASTGAVACRAGSGYIKLFLSETSFGVNTSRDHGEPYLELPRTRARELRVRRRRQRRAELTFGGNQG